MRRRDVIVLAAAALAACTPPANTEKQDAASGAPDPADAIRPLYQRYMTSPAVTTFPSLEDQAPWSASLRADLLDMMARSRAANEPILDFDPFIDAQDYEITGVTVATEALVERSSAVVRAHFVNLGQDKEVLYDLIWEADGWRVDNMRGQTWDLRQIITPPA